MLTNPMSIWTFLSVLLLFTVVGWSRSGPLSSRAKDRFTSLAAAAVLSLPLALLLAGWTTALALICSLACGALLLVGVLALALGDRLLSSSRSRLTSSGPPQPGPR